MKTTIDGADRSGYSALTMRGTDTKQATMLSLQSPETRVPKNHPLRRIKTIVDEVLRTLSPVLGGMYSAIGRPSIPPERLLKASILMGLYTVRSERLFCEQLDYNLLFRWFLDMNMLEDSFEHSSFAKNRERLLAHDVAGRFFMQVIAQAQGAGLMSDEHFTVDGTLIEAWASMKSFQRKDRSSDEHEPPTDPGNPSVDFHGEKRTNETHASTTDPEARLARKGKGKEAKMSYSAHALMENRNGLLVDFRVDEANGTAERVNAVEMLMDRPGDKLLTVGGDKGYDTRDFVADCREIHVTPHVAQSLRRAGGSAVDGRTTRHAGYELSQWKRKLVEEIFGWCKTVGNFRKTRYKGRARTQLAAYFIGAAYNLLRIAKLLQQPA